MAIADILLCIDPTTVAEGRLKLAVNLAQAHKAHLNTCYIMPEERGALIGTGIAGAPVIPAAGMVGIARTLSPGVDPAAAVVPQVAAEAKRADTVEQYFRAELRLHGLGGEWHLFFPGETGAFIELAKTVDLIILGQPSPDFRSTGFRPEDIVVAAARPILVIPYAGTFVTAGRRALVAWDGTREAVRAVNDALPLLGDAEVVTVTFVGAQETSLETAPPFPPADRRSSAAARHPCQTRRNPAWRHCDIGHPTLARRRSSRGPDRLWCLSPFAAARSPDWRRQP